MTPSHPNRRFRSPAPPRGFDPFDGVIVVDKPPGPTSHDIVDRIRRHFGFRKVGHGGTLDPQATGVLVILLGRGTKLSSVFIGSDKTYEGTVKLGVTTDSQDAQGKVIESRDASDVTEERLLEEMRKFQGDMYQTPPMVSAVKVDGVPLYKRARKGEVIQREPKLIHVYEFSMRCFSLPRAEFVLRCSKGTYARTLCADLGERLGCGAHLEQLRRTQSGDIAVQDAISVDDLLKMERDDLLDILIPLRKFASRLPPRRP